MDYCPNVDAVRWFAYEVLPELRGRWPGLRFYIVGMRPSDTVQALASDAVVVTGTVPDVRPYLQHAAIVVAPLRIARGIQNKALEAMAMARAVVVAEECAEAIDGAPQTAFVRARSAGDFVRSIEALLNDGGQAAAMGRTARQFVVDHYSWERRLGAIEPFLKATETVPREISLATALQ
jgi:glycosyltransferase involved in cell wall biosynthesis